MKLVKYEWLTFTKNIEEKFLTALKSDPEYKIFNDQYMKDLAATNSQLDRVGMKLMLVNAVILTAIFVNVSVTETEMTVLGISVKGLDQIKEILLFISATLGVTASIMTTKSVQIKKLIDVWIRYKYQKDHQDFVRIPVTPIFSSVPIISDSVRPHRFTTWIHLAWAVVFLTALVVIMLVIVSIALSLHLFVVLDIWDNSNLPAFWAKALIAYVVLCDFLGLFWATFIWIPLPYKDYSLVIELNELEKRDQKAYQAKLKELSKKL